MKLIDLIKNTPEFLHCWNRLVDRTDKNCFQLVWMVDTFHKNNSLNYSLRSPQEISSNPVYDALHT